MIHITGRFARTHRHHHRPALNVWGLLHDADLAELLSETIEQALPDILVCDFAPSKENAQFDLIAVIQEAGSLPSLRLQVVTIDLRTKPNLFQFDRLLSLARFALATALFVAELTIIHQATNRRHGVRLHLNEIEPPLTSHFHGVARTHDTDVVAFFVNQANFGDPNPFVDSRRS